MFKVLTEKELKARKRFLIEFYNRMCETQIEELNQIPTQPLKLLLDMDYISLVTPFIKEDLLIGKHATDCARKFGIGYGHIRNIGGDIGTHEPCRK